MKNIFLVLLVILPLQLIGQDFHMSQYDAAALNVNPAFTGQFRGDMRVHGHYRNQWRAVANRPFATYLVSLDFNKRNWAFGGQIANFNAGLSGYNEISVLPSIAYHHLVGKKQIHKMSYGLQVGAFQKSVNADELNFESQYVETNGGDFNTAIPNGEAFGSTSTFNLDVNVGVIYTYANRVSRINPFIGVTAYHVNLPNETFLGATNKLPVRFQVHAGSRVALTERISLTPRVFFQYQDQVDEITYGFLGHYHLKNPNFFLLAGGTYRSQKDAFIAEIGAKYGNFTGRVSYDINLSSLTTISNGRGASEFSLTYIFSKPKKYPLEKCPKIP
ncbi:MAG: PorP/SprF family type IX secretion system membrane protein [Crocinitomicaceae bacterium]